MSCAAERLRRLQRCATLTQTIDKYVTGFSGELSRRAGSVVEVSDDGTRAPLQMLLSCRLCISVSDVLVPFANNKRLEFFFF